MSWTIILAFTIFCILIICFHKRLKTIFDIFLIVFICPFVMLFLYLESKYGPKFFLLSFPRDATELLQNPNRFFNLIRSSPLASDIIPKDATFLSLEPLSYLNLEPDKNKTTLQLKIHFISKNTNKEVFEWGLMREYGFYKNMQGKVPLLSAKPIYLGSLPYLNRVCIVLEHLPFTPFADWHGASFYQVKAIIKAISHLHVFFWNHATDAPLSNWIPARHPLDFIKWIELFISKERPWFSVIWQGIKIAFEKNPSILTVCHGDCRPGNMLYRKEIANQEILNSEDVIFSDFEAINIAPFMWDFTYCTVIGMTIEQRRKHHLNLLNEYRNELILNGIDSHEISIDSLETQYSILALSLCLMSWIVHRNHLWANQGNTDEDNNEWACRVCQACLDLDLNFMANLLSIDSKPISELYSCLEYALDSDFKTNKLIV